MTPAPLRPDAGTVPLGEFDAAIGQLFRSIDRLEPLLSSASDRDELDTLRQTAQRLGNGGQKSPVLRQARKSGLRQFEPARFRQLLEMAGPENGVELLARLEEDLSDARLKVVAGWQALDWAELRGASHVLVSLAGSVGAVSLQALAESMNLAAQGQDKISLGALLAEAMGELEALIMIVGETRPVEGRAP